MKSISLRTRFVGIVLATVILPLAIVGAWLARSSVDISTRGLRDQLTQEIDSVRSGIERRWQYRMGDILLLADNEEAVAFLRSAQKPDSATIAFLDSIWTPARGELPTIEYRSLNGDVMLRLNHSQDEPGELRPRLEDQTITVRVPVSDPVSQQPIGEVLAHVRASSLTRDSITFSLPGTRFLVRHRPTGAALAITTELPAAAHSANRFGHGGEDWIAVRARIDQPEIDLVVAAPITPHIAPYRRAARIGATALIVVAVLVSALLVYLTTHTTRGLQQLAYATQALGAGDLTARVPPVGDDEVGRVGVVFNRMAESLERTLGELARQRALAAIGEFAATLSHEVRNALTAVRIDLERAGRPATDEASRRVLAERALTNTMRLEQVVNGLLRIARSGQATLATVNVLDPLRSAVAAVLVQSPNGGITIDDSAVEHSIVNGDRSALEQLFTNLLLNAVEAGAEVSSGNEPVQVVVRNEGSQVRIDISDHGRGMTKDQANRAFQPFFTTRSNGTGLGLAIARNIARAMNGDVAIAQTSSSGTTMTVTVPRPETQA
jgi:signal transduction histidine kinase